MPNFCLINKKEVVVVGRGGKGWGWGGGGWNVGIGGPNRSAKTCNKLLPQMALPGKGQSLWGRGLGFVHHSTSRSPQFSNIRSLYAIYSI